MCDVLVLALVGWLIVVLGWIYNNFLSDKRANRSELKADLKDDIRTVQITIRKITESAIHKTDTPQFHTIIAGISSVRATVERIEKQKKFFFDSELDALFPAFTTFTISASACADLLETDAPPSEEAIDKLRSSSIELETKFTDVISALYKY